MGRPTNASKFPACFWKNVSIQNPDECWPWLASKTSRGYGQIKLDRHSLAHRIAFELIKGKIPDGLQIDHLCRNRSCCNPSHMEAVTQRENVLRGIGITAIYARKTRCLNGHEFTPANTKYIPSRPKSRRCIACDRARSLAHYYLKRQSRIALAQMEM